MKKIIVAITAVTVMAFASMSTAFAEGPVAKDKGFQVSLELQSVKNVASLLQAAREMQEMNQHFSMQYLGLQQNIRWKVQVRSRVRAGDRILEAGACDIRIAAALYKINPLAPSTRQPRGLLLNPVS